MTEARTRDGFLKLLAMQLIDTFITSRLAGETENRVAFVTAGSIGVRGSTGTA